MRFERNGFSISASSKENVMFDTSMHIDTGASAVRACDLYWLLPVIGTSLNERKTVVVYIGTNGLLVGSVDPSANLDRH
ncbi:hypothetical protein MAE02_65490 [Microvirga aerophila]|uniref:Uncharacterized protein n=1 Tax=Microvirga aerophila TaxID=670291 RepID=A0A512C3R8_9HYPH|nr:hypothetical protein MAE02_65490 [Microvirga aerophila]